jgi:hypothetical protein
MLNPIFQFLKELYLAEFASFFRTNRKWCASAGWSAGSGAAGVTFFMCLNFIAMTAWIAILGGSRLANFPKWEIWIASFVIYLMNYYILVIRGQGIKFEREFIHFKKSKQTFLRTSCWMMEITSAAFVVCSIFAYHRFFHIILKSGF